ncbi:MAG: isochorismate synthase MenF [Acidimicrobiia bacterium]
MKAITRRLEHELDLNDFARGDGYLFVRDGVGFAGRSIAWDGTQHDVAAALASIDHDDGGVIGAAPVAIGVLPFAPGTPGRLVIPAVVVGKDASGQRWVTTIDGAHCDLQVPPRPRPQAGAFTVRPGVGIETYRAAVVAGRDAVRRGEIVKVVVARDLLVECDHDLDVHAILLHLRRSFGSSYRYSFEGFVGASPELLVSRQGTLLRSHPLAGTAPRTGDPATDARLAAELIASTKNQIEHRVVIDTVHDTLLPYCSYLDEEAEPSIVTVANVQHLGTAMEGRLSDPLPSVLDLARLLSPTPALGGHPREEALALLERYEGFDRGRYGGTVGWVDALGNGTWAVAIRCAEIDGKRARLFAGGGIVADSDPDSELAETQAKFQAMLSAIVRP